MKDKNNLGLDSEQLARFTEASEHPYECHCEICKEWWELVGPENKNGRVDN